MTIGSKLTRREALVAAASAAGMVLLAACGGAASAVPSTAGSVAASPAGAGGASTAASSAVSAGGASAASAKPSPAAAANGSPKRGGTLVIAQSADPSGSPAFGVGSEDAVTGGLIYQGLVYVDKARNIKPQLAESWDVSPDQLTFTFKLRQGVKWQDGQPFTSADVLYTYNTITPKFSPTASSVFSNVLQSVEAPDPATVKITLKKVYGPFLAVLNTSILPAHIYSGSDPASNPHNRMPIGTGPFVLASWTPSDQLMFQRNDSYWKPGEPYLDKIVIKIIPQGPSRISALKTGEVDYIPYTDLQPADFSGVKDDPKLQWATGLTAQAQVMVTPNDQRQPMGNKQFRQALYMAIDRATMTKQITLGLDVPATSFIHHSIGWAQDPSVDLTKQYPFDPAKANQLLDQAGFPKGSDGNRVKPLGFLVEMGRVNFDAISQFLQQQWKAIGVPVNIMPTERQLMLDTVYTKRNFDLNMNELSSGGDPEPSSSRLYTTASIQPVALTNGAGYSNPDVDKDFAGGAGQTDTAKRAPFYQDVLKLLAGDLPTLPLIDRQDYSLAGLNFEFKTTLWAEGLVYDQFSKVYQK